MSRFLKLFFMVFAGLIGSVALVSGLSPVLAQDQTEHRLALVIGNSGYKAGALPNAANDAGLLAQSLQLAGFEVMGARDLDQEVLRSTLRDFLGKVNASGPDTVAFVYLAGYGLQLEGDNYFVPVDANIARDTDIAIEAVRLSDFMRALAAAPVKSRFVVLDTARNSPFAKGSPLAGGLAYVEPEAGMLVAFNAAPGTIAPESHDAYGPYAKALSEAIREGGLQPDDLFAQVRLRVNNLTKGGQVPWHLSKIRSPFVFMERAADAPPLKGNSPEAVAEATRPFNEMPPAMAYEFALRRDTLAGYEEFLAAYPHDPLARRVLVLAAARREAITWGKTRRADRPNAYWSYLKRYPHGPHVADARRRLAELTAALEPPAVYDDYAYDIAPPPSDEIVYIDRPYIVFDDPYYDFAPPPPPVYVIFDDDYEDYAPPPPPPGPFFLPFPIFHHEPPFSHRPHNVEAPHFGAAAGVAAGAAAGAILLNNIILPPAAARHVPPSVNGQPHVLPPAHAPLVPQTVHNNLQGIGKPTIVPPATSPQIKPPGPLTPHIQHQPQFQPQHHVQPAPVHQHVPVFQQPAPQIQQQHQPQFQQPQPQQHQQPQFQQRQQPQQHQAPERRKCGGPGLPPCP